MLNSKALWLAFLLPRLASCGNVPLGGACSASNNRVDPATHKLVTDCDETAFCSAATNGSCVPRICRRDEFPFGFANRNDWPPLCDDGMFCPDEGSGCQNLTQLGRPCQLNRDEQCEPPRDFEDLASSQNSEGAICLESVCMYANVTLGQSCIVEDTKYIDIGPDGQQFSNTIIRHNCRTPLLYCDPDALQCFVAKSVGSSCALHIECHSQNCGLDGQCHEAVGLPHKVQLWQYAVTINIVAFTMAVIVVILVMVHRRLRILHHRELREYYHEQIRLRRSMFALHHHAAASSVQLEKLHSHNEQ